MQTISSFYGISTMTYLKDKEHNLNHVQAVYGEKGLRLQC